MAIRELSKREFDQYAFNHLYRSFYQTSQYGTLMSKHGYNPLYVALDEYGEIKAATLVLIKVQAGIKLGYCPRGYLIDFNDYQLVDDFTHFLKDQLIKQGVVNLIIDPHITHLERDKEGKPIEVKQKGVNISEYLKRIGYQHRGFNLYFENLKPRWNMVLKTEEKTKVHFFFGYVRI